jgi:23S rRNA pseudouridine2605 synthase
MASEKRLPTRSTRRLRSVGLARTLSKLGYCSRSQAAELVRAGRVSLNGRPSRNPETPVQMGRDRIEVDGRQVRSAEKTYLALNKPRGLVTTASDEKGRDTIYSCLPPGLRWVGPVGRLDQASEGLLLLTNDTKWASLITAPESHLEKTYHVRVNGAADEQLMAKLMSGVESDGELLRATKARLVRGGEKRSWIEVTLDEGKNRQIRRMFEQLGLEVLRLVRIGIGPLPLGDLPKGEWRRLSAEEKKEIDAALKAGSRR